MEGALTFVRVDIIVLERNAAAVAQHELQSVGFEHSRHGGNRLDGNIRWHL